MEFKEWVGNGCSLSTLNGCNHDQNGAHRLHNNKRHQGEAATVDAHDIISLLCEHLNLRFMLHEPLKSHVPQNYEIDASEFSNLYSSLLYQHENSPMFCQSTYSLNLMFLAFH